MVRRGGSLGEFLAGPLLVAVAMAFKQQGGLAVIAVAGLPVAATLAVLPIGRRLWLLGWRTTIATAVTVVGFVLLSLASGLGFGWLGWLDLMGLASTPAPLALLAKGGALFWQAGGGSYTGFLIVAGRISTALLLAVLAWIGVRFANRPLSLVAWVRSPSPFSDRPCTPGTCRGAWLCRFIRSTDASGTGCSGSRPLHLERHPDGDLARPGDGTRVAAQGRTPGDVLPSWQDRPWVAIQAAPGSWAQHCPGT